MQGRANPPQAAGLYRRGCRAGRSRTNLSPPRNSSRIRDGPVGWAWRMRSERIAAITARNDRPFNPKHAAMPKAPSATPASSGPITRARLNWIELNAIAFGTSSLLTSDGISDWCAGPPNAWARPVITDSVSTCQIWMRLK